MANEAGVIRELVARFSLQADEKSVQRADDVLDKIMGKVKLVAAAFAASEVAKFVQGILTEADELNDTAERIGTTTQALQGLGYAANLVGSDTETLNQGLKFLTKTIAEAEGGSTQAQKAFSALGVSYKNADGTLKKSDALFLEISDSISKVEDPTKRAALSMGVFSRAGQELAPLLSKGSAAISEMRAEFRALGGEFSDDFVQSSAEAKDNMDRLKAVLKGVGQALAAGVLPVVLKLQQAFIAFWKVNGVAIRERLTKAFQAVGAVMEAVGNIVEMLGKGFLGLVAAWEEGGAPLRVMLIALGGILATTIGILAPWVLIAAAIGLAVEDLYVFATGGESVIGTLVDQLLSFVTEGDTALHAFVAMILSLVATLRDGGFGALWNEVGEMLKTAAAYWWEVLTGFVMTVNDDINNGIADAFQAAWDSVAEALTYAVDYWWNLIKGFFTTVSDNVSDAISGAFNAAWDSVGEGLKGAVSSWWDIIKGFVSNVGDYVSNAIKGAVSGVKQALGFGPDMTVTHEAGGAPSPVIDSLSGLGSLFTGGPTPTAMPFSPSTVEPSLGTASGGSVYAPQTTTQVTVTAAPGMDESTLADLMVSKIDERMQEHNEAAFNAVIGAAR